MSRERASRRGDRLPSGAAGLGRIAILPDADGQRALEQVKFGKDSCVTWTETNVVYKACSDIENLK